MSFEVYVTETFKRAQSEAAIHHQGVGKVSEVILLSAVRKPCRSEFCDSEQNTLAQLVFLELFQRNLKTERNKPI